MTPNPYDLYVPANNVDALRESLFKRVSSLIKTSSPVVCRSVGLSLRWLATRLPISPNSLFTPTTRTRQNCLVLSVSVVWTQLETRQASFVLSRPSFQFATVQSQICWGLYGKLGNWKLGRDKTNLSCLVTNLFTPPTRTSQDSFVSSQSSFHFPV